MATVSLQTNLGRLRRERGLNQQQLADLAGVSKRSVAAYEVGEAEASLELLVRLADALEVALDDLVGRPTPAPRVEVNGIRYERAAEAAIQEAEAAAREADSLRPGEPPEDRGENGGGAPPTRPS